MKNFKFLLFALFASFAILPCKAQTENLQPQEVVNKCYTAVQNVNYADVKKCLSLRLAPYVDVAQKKIEDPQMKMQKMLAVMSLQTVTYEVGEEKIADDGKTATVLLNASMMGQPFTPEIKLVNEQGEWKIDDVPNHKQIMEQLRFLQAFTNAKGGAAKK